MSNLFEQKILLKKQLKTNLERLKKELTCQVCYRLFREPQTLPCSHSYCKICIKELLKRSKKNGKFDCPQCRTETSRRQANHQDEILFKLVAKLHEFWKIIPNEINIGALTQNTQYYDNYIVPKHLHASQILHPTHPLFNDDNDVDMPIFSIDPDALNINIDDNFTLPSDTDDNNEDDDISSKSKSKSKSIKPSTRSRRNINKKIRTPSRIIQSKQYMMLSQCSQIVVDNESTDDDEQEEQKEKEQEKEKEESLSTMTDNILNLEKIDNIDIHNLSNNNNNNNKSRRKRRGRPSKKTKKQQTKKQKDLSKLEKVGLIRNDFIEGEFCAICCDDVDDVGIYCDGCNVFVHMQCYGILKKPKRSEDWFCDPCKRDRNLMKNNGKNMKCCICLTNKDMAYKLVKKTRKWAHVSCSLWITGINFVDKLKLSPISIDDIDPDRYKLKCIFCKKRGGACLQCELCTNSFHVPCAHRGTAMLELREENDKIYFHSFCPLHTDEDIRKTVPDNNHDYPLYRRNNKKRMRQDDNILFRSPDIRKRKLEHSAPVILCSKLNQEQINEWEAFKEKFENIATFTNQWKNNVTHLVTSATIKGTKRKLNARTIKYFCGVIAGCWIVCFDWIEKCLLNNTLIDETKYEVLSDTKGKNACRKSRELRKKKHDNGLFNDIICIIASEFHFAKLDEDLRMIFRIGGAKILKLLPYFWLKDINKYKLKIKDKKLIFVYDIDYYDMTQKQINFCNKFNVLTIGYQQVFDSISNYKSITF